MVKFTKDFNKEVPSWQECLDNLNESFLNKEYRKKIEYGFYNTFYADKLPQVQKSLEMLDLKTAHLYVNITTDVGTFGIHKDDVDVNYWQVQGTTKWIIEKKDEYILEPGDLIYVPAGVNHSVVPFGPRVGVSMSKFVDIPDPEFLELKRLDV